MVHMPGAARITLVVGGLLVAAALAIGGFGLFDGQRSFTEIIPETVGVLLLLLAWRYRRDRLVVAASVIAIANHLVRTEAIVFPVSVGATAVALAFAIDFCLISITRDRPLRRWTMPAWLLWIAAQLWFAIDGVDRLPDELTRWFEHDAVGPGALIGGAMAVMVVFLVRRGAFEASLAWGAIAMAIAFVGWRGPHTASLLFAAAQLVLLVSVFEDSYRLAFHDDLTGLSGRRALNEALRNISGTFSIAMVDIDHFKRFNDRHGHDAGDQVLRMVADELAETGGGGRVFRYGGEEFTIIYSGKGVPEIRDTLDVIRSTIAARKFALRAPDRPRTKPEKPTKSAKAPKQVTVQISIGVAGTNTRRTTAHAVLKAADRALYRAQKAGRNRVVAAGDRLGKRG